MLRHRQRILPFMTFLALLWTGALRCPAQTSIQEFQKVLQDQAGFTAGDFSKLQGGELLVKLLPVNDKREVAVCGVVRVPAPSDLVLRAFRDAMRQGNHKSVMGLGRFSDPPTLEDLHKLTLENRDVEDLRQCTVGKCELKLSAAMIEGFQKEVDWSALDYKSQAEGLFRRMLLEYVRDYLARGDVALIEYHDKSNPVRLDEEHKALLDSSLYIRDFAPEFATYLRDFPTAQLANVENSISWTKLKFGLKPVTAVTHIATLTRAQHNAQQILVASKQIYANHYFDSSLALTAIINFPTTGAVPDSYLLYTHRVRADSLAGSFSRLKRKLVESESVDNLNDLLQQTRANVELISKNEHGQVPDPPDGNWNVIGWLFGGRQLFWGLIAILLFVAVFRLIRLNSRQNV